MESSVDSSIQSAEPTANSGGSLDDDLNADDGNKKTGKIDSDAHQSNDSPAFRLRPRRSTPRKREIAAITPTSQSKRYTFYRPASSDMLMKGGKMKYNSSKMPIKRMLFGMADGSGAGFGGLSSSSSSDFGSANLMQMGLSSVVANDCGGEDDDGIDDQQEDMFEQMEKLISKEQKQQKHRPVVLDDIEFGVFAERWSLNDLAVDQSNVGRYVCVRIVHTCRPDERIHLNAVSTSSPRSQFSRSTGEDEQVKPGMKVENDHQAGHSAETSKLSKFQQDLDALTASSRRPMDEQEEQEEETKKAHELRPRKSLLSASKESRTKSDNVRSKHNESSSTLSPRPPTPPQPSAFIRLLVQDVNSDQPGPLLRPTKPLLLLCLHGVYAQPVDKFQRGKLLELVRFEFESVNADDLHFDYLDKRMDFYPFILHMRPEPTDRWVPMISIKSAVNQPDLSQLIVINGQALLKEQQNQQDSNAVDNSSKDKMKFSSYVVKADDTDNVIALHQTKSPTIKRFMKTISSASMSAMSAGDRNHIKIKIKRNLS